MRAKLTHPGVGCGRYRRTSSVGMWLVSWILSDCEKSKQQGTPGCESDYLITQMMAEYLSHVAKLAFDEIMFQSAQRRGGTNVVLFPSAMVNDAGEPKDLPLSLADGDVRLYKTHSVVHSHEPQHVYRAPDSDGVIPIREVDEPWLIAGDDPFNGEF